MLGIFRRSLSGRSRIVFLESGHEGDKSLDTLKRHCVVKGRTAPAHRPMTLQVNQVGCGGLRQELSLKFVIAADSERNIDARTISCLNIVNIVAF